MNNIVKFNQFSSQIKVGNKKQPNLKTTTQTICFNPSKIKSQPSKDILEVQNKEDTNKKFNLKNIDKRKLALGLGIGLGAIITSTIALVKVHDTNKIKKEISKMYDLIFDDISSNDATKLDINFEKPKLAFKRLPKKEKANANYSPFNNVITINTRNLKKGWIKKDLSNYEGFIDDKNFCLDTFFADVVLKDYKDKYRKATVGEIIASKGAALYHELTHALQFQSAMSVDGIKDKMIAGYKERFSDLNEEEIKRLMPFLFSYKPKKMYSSDIKFKEAFPIKGEFRNFIYTPDSIVKSFTNYDKNDINKYTMNLTELSARNGERKFWEKLTEGKYPKPDGIDNKTLQAISECMTKNMDILAQVENYLVNKK